MVKDIVTHSPLPTVEITYVINDLEKIKQNIIIARHKRWSPSSDSEVVDDVIPVKTRRKLWGKKSYSVTVNDIEKVVAHFQCYRRLETIGRVRISKWDAVKPLASLAS